RSVTWKLGTLRAGVGAFSGQMGELAEPLKLMADKIRGEPTEHHLVSKLDPNMAWLLGVAATTAFIGTTAMYMFTGRYPENLLDVVHPQTGGKDDHGKPN